ncbi:MAG: D-2-hydroxyacid dehydrogenase [Bacteroidales bacterium]
MKLVILDALTLGNDLDMSCLNDFGKFESFPLTPKDETLSRIIDADIVITNKVILGKNEIEKATNLKLICVAATGYNNIDIEAARQQNIVVTNVKNYSTESVVQHTFALMLAIQNSLVENITDVRNGKWSLSPSFTMLNYPLTELFSKTLGIVGFGNIGRRVAEVAGAFGMNVLVAKRPGVVYNDFDRVELDEMLKKSDIVSIHTPLSDNTLNLITLEKLKLMKPNAILINMARGGIVNEPDLSIALTSKIIRAAATDVCTTEPIPGNHIFNGLNNMVITPHIAWASLESRKRLLDGIVNNIRKFISGDTEEMNLAL